MKQERDTGKAWQDESDSPRRHLRRRLRGPLLLALAAAAAYGVGVSAEGSRYALLLAAFGALCLLWRYVALRRRQRLWRGEPLIIRSVLAGPVCGVPVVREWHWASHPAVCVPLAIALTAMLYWVLVLNRLQLPYYWLLALALLLIASLWCWRHPLLLMLVVSIGVGVLSLFGWLAERLSVIGAIGVMLGVLTLVTAGIAGISKHMDKNSVVQ